MADSQSHHNPNGATGSGLRGGTNASAPRWVKVFAIISLVPMLLFAILHLVGGGLGGHMSLSGVAEHVERHP